MKKYKILIVEDEPIIALNLKQILSELEYEPFGIANSKCNTLKLLNEKEDTPDLILMDIYLQGPTTGIELAKELKITLPNVPIIFLTANSEFATIREASETFAYGYLVKPYKKNTLFATIELALKKANEDYLKNQSFESIKNLNKTLEHKLTLNEEAKSRTIKLKYGYLLNFRT